MIIGTTVFPGFSVLSPWFPRRNDNIILYAEEIDVFTNDPQGTLPELSIQLLHKNTQDTGNGVAVGSAILLDGGATKLKNTQAVALKEMVRMQITATLDAEGIVAWIHFRILNPIWYDSARA